MLFLKCLTTVYHAHSSLTSSFPFFNLCLPLFLTYLTHVTSLLHLFCQHLLLLKLHLVLQKTAQVILVLLFHKSVQVVMGLKFLEPETCCVWCCWCHTLTFVGTTTDSFLIVRHHKSFVISGWSHQLVCAFLIV